MHDKNLRERHWSVFAVSGFFVEFRGSKVSLFCWTLSVGVFSLGSINLGSSASLWMLSPALSCFFCSGG